MVDPQRSRNAPSSADAWHFFTISIYVTADGHLVMGEVVDE